MPKRKKKPYFHNNVEAIKDAPDEYFLPPDGQITYEDFMEWKLDGYEIPATVLCIIREHKPNGKVKEHVYQRRHAANQKIKRMIYQGHEFSIVDHEGCQHVVPDLPEYDDPLA